MFGRLLFTFLILSLTSCGPPVPVHKVQHIFTPPESEKGITCARQCRAVAKKCVQNADAKRIDLVYECEKRARKRAKLDYRDYVKTRKAKGKRIKRSESFFYDDSGCSLEGEAFGKICIDHYHKCFRSCGGEVHSQMKCVANCTSQKNP